MNKLSSLPLAHLSVRIPFPSRYIQPASIIGHEEISHHDVVAALNESRVRVFRKKTLAIIQRRRADSRIVVEMNSRIFTRRNSEKEIKKQRERERETMREKGSRHWVFVCVNLHVEEYMN